MALNYRLLSLNLVLDAVIFIGSSSNLLNKHFLFLFQLSDVPPMLIVVLFKLIFVNLQPFSLLVLFLELGINFLDLVIQVLEFLVLLEKLVVELALVSLLHLQLVPDLPGFLLVLVDIALPGLLDVLGRVQLLLVVLELLEEPQLLVLDPFQLVLQLLANAVLVVQDSFEFL